MALQLYQSFKKFVYPTSEWYCTVIHLSFCLLKSWKLHCNCCCIKKMLFFFRLMTSWMRMLLENLNKNMVKRETKEPLKDLTNCKNRLEMADYHLYNYSTPRTLSCSFISGQKNHRLDKLFLLHLCCISVNFPLKWYKNWTFPIFSHF